MPTVVAVPKEIKEQESRVALESLAARTAALSPSDEFFVALRAAYEGMLAALAAGDSAGAALSHLDFHRAIAVASGFERVTTILDQLAVRSLALQGWAGLSPADLDGPVRDHLHIIEAFESGDPAGGSKAPPLPAIAAPPAGCVRFIASAACAVESIRSPAPTPLSTRAKVKPARLSMPRPLAA